MKFSKNKLVLINKHYEEKHCVTSWNLFINFHENGFGRHRKKKKSSDNKIDDKTQAMDRKSIEIQSAWGLYGDSRTTGL